MVVTYWLLTVKPREDGGVGLGCSATPHPPATHPRLRGRSIASELSQRGANTQTFRAYPGAGFSLSKARSDFSASFSVWFVLSKKWAEAKPNNQPVTLLTCPRDSGCYVYAGEKSLQVRRRCKNPVKPLKRGSEKLFFTRTTWIRSLLNFSWNEREGDSLLLEAFFSLT